MTTISTAPSPSTIAQRLDQVRLTPLHFVIVMVTALGFVFDLLEVALGNVLSAVFSSGDTAADPMRLAWLLAAMYLGAIIGAPTAGWLADRFGRKRVLGGVLLVLTLTSLGAAYSSGIETLSVFRFLSGLALGAYPPLVIAYLTDIMPSRHRGLLITIVAAIASLGPVGMVFFVRWLTPWQPLGLEAWRWAFLVGSGGSLVVAALFTLLPESPRWLAAKGRTALAEAAFGHLSGTVALAAPISGEPEAAPLSQSDAPAKVRSAFVPLALLYFLVPWATVAFPVLLGAILIEKGFALSDTLLYVGISTFGPVVGTFMAAAVLDRIERRIAVAAWAGVMLIAGAAFAFSNDPVWLMVSAVVFSTFASIQQPTLSIYAAESFPTMIRARATTALWAVNRVAAALGLLMLVPLLRTAGILPMFAVVTGTLALTVVVGFGFGPKGRNLQSVD